MKAATLFTILAILSCPATSQETDSTGESVRRIWYGFISSVPGVPFGASVGLATSNRVGFYAALKMNFKDIGKDASDFYQNISEEKARNTFHDPEKSSRTGITVIEAGITGRVLRNLYAYLGVGYTMRTDYKQFQDEFRILGKDGLYWVKTGDNSTINLNGGIVLFLVRGPYLQLGFDTSPGWINLGIGFSGAL